MKCRLCMAELDHQLSHCRRVHHLGPDQGRAQVGHYFVKKLRVEIFNHVSDPDRIRNRNPDAGFLNNSKTTDL